MTERAPEPHLFQDYVRYPSCWDEYVSAEGPRPEVATLVAAIQHLGMAALMRTQQLADTAFFTGGVTFTVYSDERGAERIFPFDVIPRVVTSADWDRIERGLVQRVAALNLFLEDVYGEQRILADGCVPREIVEESKGYLPAMRGVKPAGGVYVHVAGVDLVRGPSGDFLILEDNLRTPSGVSYVLENRLMMKRILPQVFGGASVRPVDGYPGLLRHALTSLSGLSEDDTELVLLTPGPYNSAYFEHSFLARRMGCPLVQPSDLVVHDCKVYVKTTRGLLRVHVIYRRIDDDFIDPTVFRPDSLLGVPGIVDAYAAGGVVLANALGNGVADDKATYPFVPDMIRFYLAEEPILGQVETFVCARQADRSHVVRHLDRVVVKAVDGSGGYGMLMGPLASTAERAAFRERIEANPRGYIAQPLVEISACPTLVDGHLYPRRVDLRPYIVSGTETVVLGGGLTRVALVDGSYVVNSSQGGGSKDTWVLAP